jgi:hypothetical protein
MRETRNAYIIFAGKLRGNRIFHAKTSAQREE